MMKPTTLADRAMRIALAAAPALLANLPAHAHHAMGGEQVKTFGQGLLSGLAHPIIGPDHLCFLLAIGVAAAFVASGVRAIAAFMVASFAGVVLHLAQVGVPFVEPAIAVTVLAVGVLLILGEWRTAGTMLALALVGGLLHGYALAESIVGVEPTPLAAYLVGLTVVQTALMVGAMLTARMVLDPARVGLQPLRAVGVAVCLAGIYFLVTAPLSA